MNLTMANARVCKILVLFQLLVGACKGQQVATLKIPQYSRDRDLIARQNICDRYRQYEANETAQLRHALNGLQLHAGLGESLYFETMMGPDGEPMINPNYPGLAAVLMDELALRAGFDWRNTFGVFYEPDSTTNRTYNELAVWATEFYDVTVYWFDNTLERLKMGISFPEGFIDGSYILVGLADEETDAINMWGWLEPFQAYVWIMIIATIFLSGLIYQLLETIGNPNRYKGRSTHDTLGNNVFLSILLFTQHFQFQPRTPASRLFAASLALWALLTSSAYTANLASYFVVKNTAQSDINSIEDAVAENVPLCVWRGTASDAFIRTNFPKTNIVLKEDEMDIFQGIRAGQCGFGVLPKKSLEEYARDETLNIGCQLQWVGNIIQHVSSGYATKSDSGNKCTSLIHDVLNLHLREMRSDGFMEKAWNDHLSRIGELKCSNDRTNEGDGGPRIATEMAGTFIIHFVLSGCALALALATKFGKDAAWEESGIKDHDELRRIQAYKMKHVRSELTGWAKEPSVVYARNPSGLPTKGGAPNSIPLEASRTAEEYDGSAVIFDIQSRQEGLQKQLDAIQRLLMEGRGAVTESGGEPLRNKSPIQTVEEVHCIPKANATATTKDTTESGRGPLRNNSPTQTVEEVHNIPKATSIGTTQDKIKRKHSTSTAARPAKVSENQGSLDTPTSPSNTQKKNSTANTRDSKFADPLPNDWEKIRDPESGEHYYVNIKTREATWDRPLPKGWKEYKDYSGDVYYANRSLGITQWERPR